MVEMVRGAYGCCLTTGYVMNAGLQGVKLEGDLDLQGFFALSQQASPGYTDIRVKVHLNAPDASPEQLQALHEQVVNTSPVGSIISRSVKVKTELA